MKSIRLKNLRSLQDTKDIELTPVTLLVGKNGSGKSTFARFFMLLRQSIESRTKGPLLWYGDHVDFGSFEESLNRHTKDQSISFSLSMPISENKSQRYAFLPPWELNLLNDTFANVEFNVRATRDNKTYLHSLSIKINDDKIDILYDRNSNPKSINVNELDVFSIGSKYEMVERFGFFPLIRPVISSQFDKNQRHFFSFIQKDLGIVNSIVSDFKTNYCHGKVGTEKIRRQVIELAYGDKISFLSQLKKIKTLGKHYAQNISNVKTNNKIINRIRTKSLALTIPSLLIELDEYLSSVALNINYIEPVRAGIHRYYREQDLSVAEIDPAGRNLPMFLRNLTDTEKRSFNEWTTKALGFEVRAHSTHGQIALHLMEDGCTQEYNLADMGFGFSQILPIVAQLWILVKRRVRARRGHKLPCILSIEQPELHLHPDHQAKVADMFVAAINLAQKNDIDLRLVIETHSETIINRIGNLIYEKKLDRSDASVVLFEKRFADESAEISISGFDDEGCLQDWPFGFFQPEEG